MRSPFQIVVLSLLCVAVPAFAANQIYRYADDSGALNFTTELDSIPEKYRDRVIPLAPNPTPAVGAVPSPPPVLRVVKSSGEYRMGDHDTRTEAIRMAIELAKREALEQVATYLESVTEVKDMDVTRDEIRTYTAGIVTVLNQQTSTRIENGRSIIHVDLTAQVDQQEVIQAITALRENEGAKQELVALRTETDQLRQQLAAANLTLTKATTPEQVQAVTQERQQLLNHMEADALVAQALAGYAYVTPARVKQINDLLLRARQLHPENRHLQAAQQAVTGHATGLPPTPSPSGGSASLPSQGSVPTEPARSLQGVPSPLATPLPPSPLAAPLAPSPLATPLPQSPLAAPLAPSPLAAPLAPSPLAAPLGPSPLTAPIIPPTNYQPPPLGHSGSGHSGGTHGR